jgi:type II secretory pathway component PulF
VWSRAAYPLFVLHLAFVALSLPRLLAPGGGMDAFIKAVVTAIGGFWLAGFIAFALFRVVLSSAEKNAAVDRLLWPIPVLGKLRRTFALSRFCAAYNLQIDAGVNVLGSLEIAGRASGSAVIGEAAERSLPAVRAGGSVGTALAATRTFPEPFVRAFSVGEETGRLDQELRRLADEYRTTALRLLETISDWFPKIVFLCVAVYIGYQVVGFYWGYIKQIQEVLKG